MESKAHTLENPKWVKSNVNGVKCGRGEAIDNEFVVRRLERSKVSLWRMRGQNIVKMWNVSCLDLLEMSRFTWWLCLPCGIRTNGTKHLNSLSKQTICKTEPFRVSFWTAIKKGGSRAIIANMWRDLKRSSLEYQNNEEEVSSSTMRGH